MSMANQDTLTSRDFTAMVEWWRDAGVDLDFADDATDWLAEPEVPETAEKPAAMVKPKAEAVAPPPPQKIDLLGANPPTDLASFRNWWMNEPTLDAFGPRGRVASRGAVNAKLMLIVVDPEQGDTEKLLSQTQGRFVSRMLAAMQIAEDEVYFASALPRYTPMADGAALVQAGFSEVLQHHIKIASPQRVLAFGANLLPLLGHDAAQEPASLENINHEGFSVAAMATEGLDSMMAMPQLKARFWRRWLEWTGT
uniref:hypothetical protein n=1 Tax=uncultured Altererythrobacter sp. TaxID=500840 RepID=UPI002611F920|nr:hypothetical protein [uncultured Altererythrobacter sp.]